MNPFSGLRDPVSAMLAGIARGHVHAYLMAAHSARVFGHKEVTANYVSMARKRHHEYLRALKAAREGV